DTHHRRVRGGGGMRGQRPAPAPGVQAPPTADVGQERQQIGELGGSLPAGAESLERRVAGEERGVVVDVLRLLVGHDDCHHRTTRKVRGPRAPPRYILINDAFHSFVMGSMAKSYLFIVGRRGPRMFETLKRSFAGP